LNSFAEERRNKIRKLFNLENYLIWKII
jgi:hypothetical protein